MTSTDCPKCKLVHYCGPPDYGFHRCQYCSWVWPDRRPRMIRIMKRLLLLGTIILIAMILLRVLVNLGG